MQLWLGKKATLDSVCFKVLFSRFSIKSAAVYLYYGQLLRASFGLFQVDIFYCSKRAQGGKICSSHTLETHFNQSFPFASQAASAGCHCLKITISPPLSCLINSSDVQFRNFAINLLKYCWRMLIVMPVAIKTHLHNVCAKNNYELLIAQEPAKTLQATEE